LVKPPSVFAMSFATDGFSAMMRVLLIFCCLVVTLGWVQHAHHTGQCEGDATKAAFSRARTAATCQSANNKRVAAQRASALRSTARYGPDGVV
jgi:hypothetical protein